MLKTVANRCEMAPHDPLVGFIDKTVAALSASNTLKAHFEREIEWFDQRRAIWLSRAWRVGLIGITSSGKSTLVNALLDDQLLPVRVRPSSNCLVICRVGPGKAIVHFEDGRIETFKGKRIPQELSRLADETTNPSNELGVKEVELLWPRFRFGENVALVDTPGLDAFGYERHEELTMDLFLPTVDVVVFLTTAKANADGVIARYVDRIGEHRKPLILVQNMIDSIEPKLGLGGHVERSREEVARDHLARLRKLLMDRYTDCVRSAPIIQISAKLALEGALDKSHVLDLVAEVWNHLGIIKPQLMRGRHSQLLQQLRKIVTREENALAWPDGKMGNAKAEMESLAKAEASLRSALDDLRQLLRHVKEQAAREGHNLIQEAASLSPRDIAVAKDLRDRCASWMGQLPSQFQQALATVQELMEKVASTLNLRTEDYVLTPPRPPVQQPLRVEIEEHTETRQARQPGLWGTFKRTLGFPFGAQWGYETRTYKRTWLNCADFRRRLDEAVKGQLSWASGATSRVVKVVQARLATLADEIKRQGAAIQQQLASAARNDERIIAVSRLKAVAEAVSRSMALLSPDADVEPFNSLGIQDETAIIEVPKFVEGLARLTDRYLRRRFLVLRDSVLDRVGERRKGADRWVLLWSFEADSLERFLRRFWFDVLQGPLAPGSVLELIQDTGPFKMIGVGKEVTDGNKQHSQRALAKRFLGKASTVFLLLDAQQPGSTKSQLAHSEILPILKHAGGLVVVVQSLKGLPVAESLYELTRIATEFGLRPDAYLANDDEVILSVLIDRLAMDGERLRSQRDEMRWLGGFEFFSQEQRDRCAKILRDWREMSKPKRERFHG